MHFEKAAGEPCLLFFYCHLLDDRLYLELPKGLLLARPKIHKGIQPLFVFCFLFCCCCFLFVCLFCLFVFLRYTSWRERVQQPNHNLGLNAEKVLAGDYSLSELRAILH